jgi:histone acetyltransferase SAS3
MPPLLEDEFEDSSDAMEDEIQNGIAEDAGEDGQSPQALEEDDGGDSRVSSGAHGDSDAEENGEQSVDGADASDAESESGEESGDGGSDTEAVGAVKIRPADASSDGDAESEAASSAEDNESEEVGSAVEPEAVAGVEELSEASNESDTSEEEAEEFHESSGSEEEEGVAIDRNSCVFCKQGEEDDPSEDFEPYLTCSVCGDHSHQQCARDHNAMNEENDGEKWRCPTCVDNNLEAQSPKSPESKASRPRSSAPRLVRDLLPVSRGIQRPDSHSIFAQPLISEGRLRKRKSPTGEPQPPMEKRRRRATPRALSISNSNDVAEDAKSDVGKMDIETSLTTRSTRRASHKAVPLVRVIQQRPYHKDPPYKFILAFHLEQSKIAKVLSKPPKPRKTQRRDRRRVPKIPPPPIFEPPIPKFPALPTNHLIFPSVLTERENEMNSKPYGGILSESDADTGRSLPAIRDREIFEAARKEAEEERRKTSAAADSEANADGTATTARTNRTVSGPPTKIKCIQFGKFVIDTFYASPYPEEYSHESRLFICEFCLKYLPSEFVAYRHKLKCPAKHPPGDEIYRDASVSIWEVDGRKKTEYCQCLCLMAKMFLGSKTLYYDVEPFLFYILTEYDELGYHFVGYFSKEKRPASLNNVSCILVMPIHQRKGYATFLIDFSYLLTRIEGKEGSPEKPLSDMGLTAYRSYWDLTISRHLLDLGLKPFSARTLMDRTGMTADDVIHSLERLYAFIRDPVTKSYAIRFDRKLYTSIVESNESKGYRQLQPGNLVWTPYVMGRSDHAMLDDAPMQTIAPREGEDVEDDEESSKSTKQPGQKPAKTINGVSKDNSVCDEESAASPKRRSPKKSKSRSKSKSSKAEDESQSANGDADIAGEPSVNDSAPVDNHGHIAPGPPPTSTLDSGVPSEVSLGTLKMNGITNGVSSGSQDKSPQDEAAGGGGEAGPELTGYALAFRTLEIPPTRFQIDPAIPPSMLRSRSTKKRSYGGAFGRRPPGLNGSAASPATTAQPVRSSPRNASTANGSEANWSEKAGTPIRRSARGSKLATELVSLDGPADDEDASEDQDEEAEYGGKKEESTSSASEVEAEAEDDESEEEDEEEVEVPEDDENDEEEDDEEEE